jgi:hypothetical protein
VRVTEAPASVTGTEATEVREPKTRKFFFCERAAGSQGMEGNGGQVRAEGTAISSTASDDVDMMDGQDQETVAGSGIHLGGLVAQKRTKVKNSNASEKVTADVLARRILDYGIVKVEKTTNVV